jgi:hypothetical protein
VPLGCVVEAGDKEGAAEGVVRVTLALPSVDARLFVPPSTGVSRSDPHPNTTNAPSMASLAARSVI